MERFNFCHCQVVFQVVLIRFSVSRSQTLFGNAASAKLCFAWRPQRRRRRETEFRPDPFPNKVWEPEAQHRP